MKLKILFLLCLLLLADIAIGQGLPLFIRNGMTTNVDHSRPTAGQSPVFGAGVWAYAVISGSGGAATTNLIKQLGSTNGFWIYSQLSDGNTNAFFVLTNVPLGNLAITPRDNGLGPMLSLGVGNVISWSENGGFLTNLFRLSITNGTATSTRSVLRATSNTTAAWVDPATFLTDIGKGLPRLADWSLWNDGTNYWAANSDLSVSYRSNDFAGLFQRVHDESVTNALRFNFGSMTKASGGLSEGPYQAFTFSNTVTITKSCVLVGAGNPPTIFWAGRDGFPLLTVGTPGNFVSGIVSVENIRFQTPNNTNSTGILFTNVSEPNIRHCEFNNFKYGVRDSVTGQITAWAIIRDTWFVVPSAGIGLLLDGIPNTFPNDFAVMDCKFESAGGVSISVSNAFNNVRIGNNFFGRASGGGTAILIAGGRDFGILNNTFFNYTASSPVVFAARGSLENANSVLAGNVITTGGFQTIASVGANVTGVIIDTPGTLVKSLDSTNGFYIYTQLANGNTNAFFVVTNVPIFGISGLSQTNFMGLLQTNFISGFIYTNATGVPLLVSANAIITTAAVNGDAAMDLRVTGSGGVTNPVAAVTTVAVTLVMTYTNTISAIVPAGGTYTFTNTSTGSGNTSTVNGGQIGYISQSIVLASGFSGDGSGLTNQIRQVGITIDGSGSAITTGLKGYITVPYNGSIQSVTMLADQSGSAAVDIWKCTYAQFDAGSTHPVVGDTITGSAIPTITTATKSTSSTLTGWTNTVTAGDILAFKVNSATTITRLTLTLKLVTQ